MQEDGLLSDSGDRCHLCAKAVGSGAPHTCRSPLVRTFTADLSAVVEPWRGLDQAAYTPLRRLQGQVLVVMPEEAHMQHPQRALDAGSFMMFQGVVAMSRVVAAGQQRQQAEQPGNSDSSGDEPLQGRGLGLYSLLGLQAPTQAAAAAAGAQPGRDGHPRLQQTWVCPYTGQLQEHVNQASASRLLLSCCRLLHWHLCMASVRGCPLLPFAPITRSSTCHFATLSLVQVRACRQCGSGTGGPPRALQWSRHGRAAWLCWSTAAMARTPMPRRPQSGAPTWGT